jgi:hypothetical protein
MEHEDSKQSQSRCETVMQIKLGYVKSYNDQMTYSHMRKWWFISSLGTEFIPTTPCITWKVKLVGPFNKEEQRGSIIIDLNIGHQSISFILLQYLRHHVIPHNTFPTTTCPTTRYLVWSYIMSIWNIWIMPQRVKIDDGLPFHTSSWSHHPCRAKPKWNPSTANQFHKYQNEQAKCNQH